MEMILTGSRLNVKEAHRYGLVSAIYPSSQLIDEAIKTAELIASHSKTTMILAKAAINQGKYYQQKLIEY